MDIQYISYYYQKRLQIYSIYIIIIRKDYVYTIYLKLKLKMTIDILYIDRKKWKVISDILYI